MYEPRCRICTHPDAHLINRILSNPRITKNETIRAVSSLSLRAGLDVPSWMSILRHKTRHLSLGTDEVKAAPDDFKVETDEQIADEKSLNEAMIYSISGLNLNDFTKFNEALLNDIHTTPPIWSLQSFEKYLMRLVDGSIPWMHEEILIKYRYHISKYYP